MVITDLSRLARNLNDQTYLVDDVFKKSGIKFCNCDGNWDTSTAVGRLNLNLMGAFNQYQSEATGERTSEAMKWGKQNGKRYGMIPYGYVSVNGMLYEDPGEPEIIREARRLRARGMTLRDIRKSLRGRGYVNRKGNGFSLDVLSRMVAT